MLTDGALACRLKRTEVAIAELVAVSAHGACWQLVNCVPPLRRSKNGSWHGQKLLLLVDLDGDLTGVAGNAGRLDVDLVVHSPPLRYMYICKFSLHL